MSEPIQDKAPKPPGLLPKNVQSWLIFGLAVLMVVIMWLTGGKKQAAPRTVGTLPQATPTVEVNEAKIAELQNRIQEQQREQLVAQNALAQQSRILGAAASSGQVRQRAALRPNAPKTPSRRSARSAAIFRCLLRTWR